jgi:hypothetical protein
MEHQETGRFWKMVDNICGCACTSHHSGKLRGYDGKYGSEYILCPDLGIDVTVMNHHGHISEGWYQPTPDYLARVTPRDYNVIVKTIQNIRRKVKEAFPETNDIGVLQEDGTITSTIYHFDSFMMFEIESNNENNMVTMTVIHSESERVTVPPITADCDTIIAGAIINRIESRKVR